MPRGTVIKFIFVLIIIRNSFALDLPSYIKPCSVSDSNYRDCLIKSAESAIPHLRKGDSRYKIPNIDPIKLPMVKIDMGDDLKMVFTNVTGYHVLEDAKVKDVEFDLSKGILKLQILSDGFTGDALYNINMKLLGLPIVGNGTVKVKVTKFDIIYDAKLKTDSDHFQLESSQFDYTIEKIWVHFDNLFNGDERLGEATNKLINENWKDFADTLKPASVKTFGGVIDAYLKGIFDAVPKSSVVLP